MERKINISSRIVLAILYVMYIVGIIGHSFEPLYNYMLILTPITLLFTGGLLLYKVLSGNNKLIQWIIVVYISTFCLEVIGVKTGLLFGAYYYGSVLAPKLMDTPLIIGLNWALVIMGAVVLIKKYFQNNYVVIFVSPLLAVLFDIFLEPVAIKLGYWSWAGSGSVPIQNYIAWYIIAMLASLYFVILKIEVKSYLPIHYFGIQTVFFLILNFTF